MTNVKHVLSVELAPAEGIRTAKAVTVVLR